MNDLLLEKKPHKGIKIELASPDTIRSWSHGAVLKPETINYKSLKAEKDGLFDERIFGPTKNYECACGKYKRANPMNKGKVCEKCGVELTESIVRRERMGHIELEEPVTHIWMLKVAPSRIAVLLDLKTKELEEVVYFVSHIVLEPGANANLKVGEVLDLGWSSASKTRDKLKLIIKGIKKQIEDHQSRDYIKTKRLLAELANPSVPFSIDEATTLISKYTGAKFGIGAEAVEYLLKKINISHEIKKVKNDLKNKRGSNADQSKLMRRLEVLDSFEKSKAKPEWMVLHVLPVIPPDIRPIIQLDGGRFTTSEINDLYRRIIIRNERLKKIKEMGAPSIIINNEKRMLQEAVDGLLDNERKPRPVIGKDKRPLKSLTATLKGKQGRFRQNLLGKRVDYSGRSVIVVEPSLKMYQAGIPRDMAITLFKPFVIRWLQEYDYAENVKVAEKMIQQNDPRIWEALEQVIKERPVLLNRAPTLHRLGIQAFEPKLVKGKAIRLHPLVTTAFNADFDGDQMAIHLPITDEAVAEARVLMSGANAILGPKDGKAIVTPTQDMILGNYYLTSENKGAKGEGTMYFSSQEALRAYETDNLSLNALIGVPVNSFKANRFAPGNENKYLLTTVGKIIFNDMFVKPFPWLNGPDILNAETEINNSLFDFDVDIRQAIKDRPQLAPIKKKELSLIIEKYFEKYGSRNTAQMLDNMKDNGYLYSTKSGTTISAGDVVAFTKKYEEFKAADKKVAEITKFYDSGMLTASEKKKRIIQVWSAVKDNIQKELDVVLRSDKENPIFVMADSGARGNVSNFTQLVGMRGLMNDTKGDVKEIPIRSSFREGLNVSEYFISTHGARKGMADIALKTADSGYLTRRLVDVSQEIVVTEKDCHPTNGFKVSAIIDTKHNNVIVPLRDRLIGRFTFENVEDAQGKTIVPKNTLITKELADQIVAAGIQSVFIRSVLTCEDPTGVCQMCYGVNLATGELVKIGEPVGVIAAQSIGEPGTQLTMRNFHTGGVAGDTDITQGLPRIKELLDVTIPKGSVAVIAQSEGTVTGITKEATPVITVTNEFGEDKDYNTQFNSVLRVKKGDKVKRGQKLTEGAIDLHQLLEVARIEDVQNYILKEIQKVYRLQGIEIADKYIEIIIKQMLNKVRVIDGMDTDLLQGTVITTQEYQNSVADALMQGKKPALVKPVIFGIKKAPLESKSWLSSASFQDTARVLSKAIIRGKVDHLEGLKENIMLGNLIPAGTGLTGIQETLDLADEWNQNRY